MWSQTALLLVPLVLLSVSLPTSARLNQTHTPRAHGHTRRHRDHFHSSDLSRRAPTIPAQLPGTWTSKGCYTDVVATRTLSSANYVDTSAMTIEGCISYCESRGFSYAGTEFSQECFCGDSPRADAQAVSASDCNMACKGNANELCGGGNRINIFFHGTTTVPTTKSWAVKGCYTDQVAARTLGTQTTVNGPMTVGKCQAACLAGNFQYSGVEYAQECFCGNTIQNGAPAPDGDAQCNMACAGDASQNCGGGNRLKLYQLVDATNPPASNGWQSLGCYTDATQRTLGVQQTIPAGGNTIASCQTACFNAGYKFAGVEYSNECYCDSAIRNGAGPAPDGNSQCNMPCSGDANSICGGPWRLNMFSYSGSQNPPTNPNDPPSQPPNTPGQWQYQGCITDNVNARTLPYRTVFKTTNNPTTCLNLCAQYGYPAAGMEYGEECFCGDVSDVTKSGAQTTPSGDCSMACTGDASTKCGGSNRLSYYKYSGTLYTWHTPANKGRYEFLIGGVVVPLITTLGTNNKVTFVEKYGSGPPNSTGAYELDVSQVNNFSKAWRTMHVKSDVFCSGGLTLPDKVGRQINVGGWSGQSLQGVRLYWPDGSPGVAGTNDWQENFNEVRLQRARWYPGAMMMANGSILVVGGEDSVNGAPTPSVEVLPKPAGGDTVRTMDWLQQTDPNNLYPFLFVLPSGGIFVIYYNQARVLNEQTFATTKVLPTIPGAVNDFTSGRTYPMEGTAVLLPQRAPYTDPLTVMACGGATPAGNALDNCVSIQPDVANAQWVIERMPSTRVLSCMVSLPDGTYLILNGAHQGLGGFALATDPNTNAVLYDPSQPVGSRFSVLGSTNIARLYHSEATLLQDGRVLVSGSDPEDSRFPQEYRVEVYIPPYLASGLAQPTFTIANKDWAYNGAYQIQVQLRQGSTGTMKISLVAAVSSTHGNSMGQRILFPAFTCAGNTCTITAPPNAHICPPGWFQLFVLDGPTPSSSTWVRIGGDPARLGNWPPFNDFSKPGL